MDLLAEAMASRLLDFLNDVYPSGAVRAVGASTWNDYLAAVSLLLGGTLTCAWIAYLLRKRSAISSKLSSTTSAPHHVIATVSRPLYLIIVLYTIYFASQPLVSAFSDHQSVADMRAGFGTFFNLGALGALLWFGLRLTSALETQLVRRTDTKNNRIDVLLIPMMSAFVRTALTVIAILIAISLIGLPDRFAATMSKITSIVFIVAVATVLIRLVRVGEQMILTRYDITAADNLEARKIYTQLHVIGRVLYVAIGVVSAAAILMLFDQVRHLGTSLLASAGIAGIIVGFAAQKTLANLFAGFQIALAQPMRQDDVVIVEGEWGRIEEITLSYVVVHIWDDRRLIVPLSYFIEKPFQNWTRTSAAILGSVMVHVDYTCEVETIRKELKGIVEGHPLWDGRFWNLQVTDATERTLQLRVLATSADASKSFDLRCAIREQLISYIQQSQPRWLPRERADVVNLSAA